MGGYAQVSVSHTLRGCASQGVSGWIHAAAAKNADLLFLGFGNAVWKVWGRVYNNYHLYKYVTPKYLRFFEKTVEGCPQKCRACRDGFGVLTVGGRVGIWW